MILNFVLRNKVAAVRHARYVAMAGLVLVSVLPAHGAGAAQGEASAAAVVQTPQQDDFVPAAGPAAVQATTQLYLVRTTDTSTWSPSSPDPSGITYHPPSGQLIVADGEVDEIKALFTTKQNVFRANLGGALAGTMSTIGFTPEPTGVSYNPADGHLFYSDDDAHKIYEVSPGSDGALGTGDDSVTSFDVSAFGSLDPEDVTYDLIAPGLWIIDGANAQVYHLLAGANGRFDGVAPGGDDVLDQFDTRRLGIIDPEGIYRDPATGNLILTSADPTKLYEVSTAGALVRTCDVSAASAIKLAGGVMAPSSTTAGVTNFYLVDRAVDNNDNSRENDGRIYEFTRDKITQPTPIPTPTAAPTAAPTATPTATALPPTATPPPSLEPSTTDVLWLPLVGR